MSTPYEIREPFTLILSDRGVAVPAAHAASHASGGSDEITIASSQITGLGTMATQGSGAATLTGGTISGVTLSSSAATLTGGTINGMVIGGSTAADGTFDDLTATGTTTLAGTAASSLSLTTPLPITSGGTGASGAATARTNLGLDSMATQASSAVAITGGTISGTTISGGTFAPTSLTVSGTTTLAAVSASSLTLTTDLAVTEGGTGASSASAARTNLGLVIGTDVQAYDADLAALAGLTSAADRVPYFTGSSTAALATFTSFARTLVAASDAATARSVLGVSSGSINYNIVTSVFLTAGASGFQSDGSITSTSIVIPVPVYGTGTGNPGHLEVTISDGSGYSVNSTDAADDRELTLLVIY